MFKVTLDAGTIESWSTGDADILESDFFVKLYAASEEVSRKGHPRAEVMIEIVAAPQE